MAIYQGAIIDPYGLTLQQRPVQIKTGSVDYESIGLFAPRPTQIGKGYFLESNSKVEDTTKLNPPRASPLEIRWKQANKSNFEK